MSEKVPMEYTPNALLATVEKFYKLARKLIGTPIFYVSKIDAKICLWYIENVYFRSSGDFALCIDIVDQIDGQYRASARRIVSVDTSYVFFTKEDAYRKADQVLNLNRERIITEILGDAGKKHVPTPTLIVDQDDLEERS